jgi:hypothetical protein
LEAIDGMAINPLDTSPATPVTEAAATTETVGRRRLPALRRPFPNHPGAFEVMLYAD